MSLSVSQLQWRRNRITATRASNICNGRWRSVVEDMLGLSPKFRGNKYTRWGQAVEPHIITEFCTEYGIEEEQLLPVTTFIAQDMTHEGFRWTAATPDALWYDKDGGLVMLECKTTGPEKFLKEWGAHEGGWEDVPKYYQGQVLWQSRLLNLSMAYITVRCGTHSKVMKCPRRFDEEQLLVDKCFDIWKTYIWERKPLPEKEKKNEQRDD